MSKRAGCLLLLVILFVAGAIVNAGSTSSTPTPATPLQSDVAHAAASAPVSPPTPAARKAAILAMASGTCRPSSARVGRVLASHPEWDDSDIWVVACRHVRAGLTQAQLLASWGQPDHVNSTVIGDRRSDQYVYGDNYVYVEDGSVTSYQTSR